MLGAVCQSELKLTIGPFGMATEAASKRAKAAREYLQAIQRFAHSGAHQHAAHMAWVLASCGPARALDFDAKHLPSTTLEAIAAPLAEQVAQLGRLLLLGPIMATQNRTERG